MFVGNLWILVKSLWRREETFPSQAVARLGDLPAEGPSVFRYPGPTTLPADADADGSYVAYSQKCTHLSCAVFPSQDGKRLECPCHEGYFSAATGGCSRARRRGRCRGSFWKSGGGSCGRSAIDLGERDA
jgi:Rieske Fe-S protein